MDMCIKKDGFVSHTHKMKQEDAMA